MGKKNGKLYLILLVLLLFGAVLLPFGINFVTDAAVDAILSVSETDFEPEETETETETEAQKETESEECIPDCEPETEPETEADTEPGEEKAVRRKDTASSGAARYGESEEKDRDLIEEQIEFASGMEAFLSSFSPKITVLAGAEDSRSDFFLGGEEAFLKSVGEYVYSHYGDLITLDEIELIETVRVNEAEVSVQANLISGEESEIFIISYDRELDIYGVYPPYYAD